ncbi:MAG: hypothetical protein QGG40_14325, partial [Myxococcota bacterium]|nr:hypothetical protein [Myxococcota bacterium]
MGDAVAVLYRMREYRKRTASLSSAEAERACRDQEDRVDEIKDAIDRSHTDEEVVEATWLAQQHAYRGRMSLRLRRENVRLDAVRSTADTRRKELNEATRDANVLEEVLETRAEQKSAAQKRANA